jgi:hypothetical protein
MPPSRPTPRRRFITDESTLSIKRLGRPIVAPFAPNGAASRLSAIQADENRDRIVFGSGRGP